MSPRKTPPFFLGLFSLLAFVGLNAVCTAQANNTDKKKPVVKTTRLDEPSRAEIKTLSLMARRTPFRIEIGSSKFVEVSAYQKMFKPIEGRYYFLGNVHVVFRDTENSEKDSVMTCSQAIIFLNDKEVFLGGQVVITHRDYVIRAEEAVYHYEQRRGMFRALNFKNHRIAKGDDGDFGVDHLPIKMYSPMAVATKSGEIVLNDVKFSTCALGNPAWRVEARKVLYQQGSAIRSWGNTFFIGPLPVFYWSKLDYGLGAGKKGPWMRVRAGNSGTWGAYVLTRWGIDLSRDLFAYLDLDYRHLFGNAAGLGARYDTGNIKGDYHVYSSAENRQDEIGGPVLNHNRRWRVKMEHKQILEGDWGMQVLVHGQADENMLHDYFRKESKDDPEQETSGAFFRNSRRTYLEFFTETKINDWETKTEYLPEARFSVMPWALPGGFYYQSESRLGRLRRSPSSSLFLEEPDVQRLDVHQELSKPFTVLRTLPSEVYVGSRHSLYSRNRNDETDRTSRGMGTWGAKTLYRMQGIYDVGNERFNINSLRHIVEPSVRFDSIGEPTTRAENLLQFDEVDAIGRDNVFTFQLNNVFQTKRSNGKKGKEKKMSVWQLAEWRLIQRYYPMLQDRLANNNGRAFSLLFSELDFARDEKLSGFIDTEWDRYQKDVTSFDAGVTYVPDSKRYTARLENRYEQGIHHELVAGITAKLSPVYKAGFRIKHDWRDPSGGGEFGIAFSRNMRCWTLITGFEVDRDDGEKRIWFDILPDFYHRDKIEAFSLWD